MLKLSVVLVLLACCTAHAANSRTLKQAFASGSVTSTGGVSEGTIISKSTSSAETVKDEIVKFCKAVFNQYTFPVYQGEKQGFCKRAYSVIDEDLKAVGKAIAEAYASTTVSVSVRGSGRACGSAEAQAQSHAKAVAEIFFEALAIATNKYDNAEISAELRISTKALAFAFAKSWAEACAGDNSNALVVQETYASASVKLISTLTIWLVAKVDCTGYSGYVDGEIDADSQVIADTFASSSTLTAASGNAFASGGGVADSGSIDGKCTGIYAKCCHEIYDSRVTCSCFDPDSPKRCDAMKETLNGKLVWLYLDSNNKATSCFC